MTAWSLVRVTTITLGLTTGALFLPGTARAQTAQSGAIAGEARDTTGAVMPGVTVEAASPALIEKVRTAVTDSQGRYQITELRHGRYTVTSTLTGADMTSVGTKGRTRRRWRFMAWRSPTRAIAGTARRSTPSSAGRPAARSTSAPFDVVPWRFFKLGAQIDF